MPRLPCTSSTNFQMQRNLTLRRGELFEVHTFTLLEDGLNPGHIHLRFRGQMSGDGVVIVRFVAVQ